MADGISNRVKKIQELVKKRDSMLENYVDLEKQIDELEEEIRQIQIGKKNDGTYHIICECENTYYTNKDPNAPKKENRPQCKQCGKRVKRKG